VKLSNLFSLYGKIFAKIFQLNNFLMITACIIPSENVARGYIEKLSELFKVMPITKERFAKVGYAYNTYGENNQ